MFKKVHKMRCKYNQKKSGAREKGKFFGHVAAGKQRLRKSDGVKTIIEAKP